MAITINGVRYDGDNVDIVGGRLLIDGREVKSTLTAEELKQAVIEVSGILGKLVTDLTVNVKGSVEGDVTAGGSVNCDDVKGSVKAGGSVNCDDVGSDVNAGGSVNCDDVGGSVTASVVRRG